MIKKNIDIELGKDISVKEYFESLSENVLMRASQNSNTEDNSGSWYEMANWFQWNKWSNIR